MSSYLIPFIQTGIANSSNTANTSNTANYANFAGNVVNASQPNITSIGSLSSLVVTGTSNIANLNANGVVTFNGSNVSLGSVSNLHIDGGTNGYVLQTDGIGNLTWVAQTGGGGNGTPGGSNTQVQYNDAGSFAGSSQLYFNNVSNIVVSKSLVSINKGQIINANVVSNGYVTCNILNGTNIINIGGMANVTAVNFNPRWNIVGDANTTLNSLMNNGDVLEVTFKQLVINNSGSNITWNYANGVLSNPLNVYIDGNLIPQDAGFPTQLSNVTVPGPAPIGNTTLQSGNYLYITNIFNITKKNTNEYYVHTESRYLT